MLLSPAGTSNKWRFDHDCPQTNTPALVYIPAGTYRITSSIKLLMNTILIGDPLHMPVLKADANLGTNAIIYAYDSRADSATTQFYKGIRNIIFDTTAVSTGTEANALNWPVSQACSLFNVNFRMPNNSGHIGIIMAGVTGSGEVQGGSGTIMGDLVRSLALLYLRHLTLLALTLAELHRRRNRDSAVESTILTQEYNF
jgi:glucan 1,3-beta-glucosidase